MTLNAGFAAVRGDKISAEDHVLIDEFIKRKGVTVCTKGATSQPEGYSFNNRKRPAKNKS
jgi:hypothetical protein